MVLPPQRLYLETIRQIRDIGRRIAAALSISGPFNIQFIAKDNEIKVIECNLRASRSFPFVSKVSGVNFINLAVRALLGRPVSSRRSTLDLNYVGVKAPQFSFSRLKGADPILGVEMASTGEVGCLGRDVQEAFLKAILAVGFRLPKKNILVSVGGAGPKHRFLDSARTLRALGYALFATENTSAFLKKNGVDSRMLYKVHERRRPNIKDHLLRGEIDLVISIPDPAAKKEFDSYSALRRMAVDYSVPLLTNLQIAELFVQSLAAKKPQDLEVKAWDEYR
jgi:carbamoyl-phosphate synthase large subunit